MISNFDIFDDQTDTPPRDYNSTSGNDISNAVDEAIDRVNSIYSAVAAVNPPERTFENTIRPLDEVTNLLIETDGAFCFLAYVSEDKSLRQIAEESDKRMASFRTELGFRTDIFRAVQEFNATKEYQSLKPVEQRLCQFIERDFKRNGLALDQTRQNEVQKLRQQLVEIGISFRKNIDEFEDYIVVSEDDLAGLPENYIANLKKSDEGGSQQYQVSLDYPEMFPFMETSSSEEKRRELFLKNHNKAAAENLPLLQDAIRIRSQIAKLLGYQSWSEYSIELKMAKTPLAAKTFLIELEQQIQKKSEHDLRQLTEAKRADTKNPTARLEIWDWRYYQQRVKADQYNVNQFEVADYFPLEQTLEGMFSIYQRLTGVAFTEIKKHKAWHPDVRLYAITEAHTKEHIAHFYMDLHPRQGKYGHAAAFTLKPSRLRPDDTRQPAISAIVANFTKPSAESPSLLRHSEVETLFHEFGHILHQTLTRAPFSRFSGTAVERDFVEAPSQMLEHWTWEKTILEQFTSHKDTGEPIPPELIERMKEAKNIGSGIHYLRQIYFARLDLAYHDAILPADTDIPAQDLHSITGFEFPEDTHFQAGFGHLFGYDAGYYGYLWSQVFGDDMFTRFANGDPLTVGQEYRTNILEPGGSLDGHVQLEGFLGRAPDKAAFLKGIGLG